MLENTSLAFDVGLMHIILLMAAAYSVELITGRIRYRRKTL